MDRTPNLNLPIPNENADPPTKISQQFPDIAIALTMLDTIIHTLQGVVAGKADANHNQAMSTITGLVEALAAKMPANVTFSLDSLTDVEGAAEAAVNYVLVKNAEGNWVPSSALAAIGEHEHSVAQIVGLAEALADKATQDSIYTKTEVNSLLDAKGVPLGTVVHSALNLTTQGYLLLDGSPISPLTPDLRNAFLAAGAPFGMSGSDPLLPDEVTASRFRRAANGSIPLGTVQDDQMQGHRHWRNPSNANDERTIGGPGGTDYSSVGGLRAPINVATTGDATTDGVNGTPRVGDETRPKSIAYLPYIKAFGAITIEGMADLSQLLNAIADEPTAILGENNTLLMTALRTRQFVVNYNKWEDIEDVTLSAAISYIRTGLSDFSDLKLEGWLIPSVSASIGLSLSIDNGASWQATTDVTTQVMGVLASSFSAGSSAAANLLFSGLTVQGGATLVFEPFRLFEFNKNRRLRALATIQTNDTSGQNYTGTLGMITAATTAGQTARNAIRIIPSAGTLSGRFTLSGKRG